MLMKMGCGDILAKGKAQAQVSILKKEKTQNK